MRRKRPPKQPARLRGAHVDTTVAHAFAKIIVPVCAVEGMSKLGEIQHPRNAGEFVVVNIRDEVAVAHVDGRSLFENVEFAPRRDGGDLTRLAT